VLSAVVPRYDEACAGAEVKAWFESLKARIVPDVIFIHRGTA
jgi:hypothetical protein